MAHTTRRRPITGATHRLDRPLARTFARHRTTILWLIGALVFLRLMAVLPQDAPRSAETTPAIDQSINIGSKNDVCIGWCPK